MAEKQIVVRRFLAKETRIQDSIIWDGRMSIPARFTLIAMLSLRQGWDYSVRGMATMLGVNKDTMGKYLRELEEAGYLKRLQDRANGGRFSRSTYILTDTPGEFGEEETETEEETPCPELPCPKVSPPENPPQQNNVIKQQKRKEELTPLPPTGERRGREPKSEPDWKPERFTAFWKAYPCGKSKQAAIRAWDKLRADDTLLTLMAEGLKRDIASPEWQRGIGIPYASTWLNNRRWEDEVKAPTPQESATTPPPDHWGWD